MTARHRARGLPAVLGPRGRRAAAVVFWLAVVAFTAVLVRDTVSGLRGTAAAGTGVVAALVWLALLTAARAGDVGGWYALLRGTGLRGRFGETARVYTVSELVRYLPGGVLHFAARYRFATAVGVRAEAVVSTTVADVVLRLGCGVALFVATLPWWPGLPAGWIAAAALALPVTAVAASPKVLHRVLSVAGRRLGRGAQVPVLGYRCLAWASAAYLGGWVVRGLVTWLMARDLLGVGPGTAAVMVGVTGIAWVVGVVVPFAPGGLGVREAVGVALLAPFVPADAALMLMLLTRLGAMAAEGLAVGLVLAGLRLKALRARRAPAAPQTVDLTGTDRAPDPAADPADAAAHRVPTVTEEAA